MNKTSLNCDVVFAGLPSPPPLKSLTVKSIYCLFILLVSVIALFGNLLVIISVGRFKNLRKRTNAFVVTVACADVGVAIFVMPFRLYEEWYGGWLLGNWFCLFVNMFDGIFCSVSMGTLCCVAFERYLAVCRPFLYEKLKFSLIVGVIVAVWAISIIVWSVILFNELHAIGIEDIVMCVTDGACPLVVNLTVSIMLSTLTFWMPSVVMLFCYWKIFVTANRHMRAIHETTISEAQKRANVTFLKATKAAKTLGIVVGCFLICWLPFFVVFVGDAADDFQWSIPLKISVMWLGYVNSMINPFLYYMFSSDFRAAFKLLFKCKRGAMEDISFSTTAGPE